MIWRSENGEGWRDGQFNCLNLCCGFLVASTIGSEHRHSKAICTYTCTRARMHTSELKLANIPTLPTIQTEKRIFPIDVLSSSLTQTKPPSALSQPCCVPSLETHLIKGTRSSSRPSCKCQRNQLLH